MSSRFLAIAAIALWTISAVIIGAMYFKSRPQMHGEDRIIVKVTETERKFVLKEMRMMLESLQGILMALETDDWPALAEAADSSGNVMLSALPPTLMPKMPKDFRSMAIGSHQGFSTIADTAKPGASRNKIIELLSEQLGSCTACHDTYRFQVAE